MSTHRVVDWRARWVGLAFALASSAGNAESVETAPLPRFTLGTVQAEIKTNVSVSGRFGAVAQAQTRYTNSAGKRYALLGAEQCRPGVPTPGGIFANGFE
jgi:hypothetical protein